MIKETNFLVDICKQDPRLAAKIDQEHIDQEIKKLRKRERQIKGEIEELERRFNRLG